MGKHITALELLTSCLNLAMEPGIMLPFNGLPHLRIQSKTGLLWSRSYLTRNRILAENQDKNITFFGSLEKKGVRDKN